MPSRQTALLAGLLLLAACRDTSSTPGGGSTTTSTSAVTATTVPLSATDEACSLLTASAISAALGVETRPGDYPGGCLFRTDDGTVAVAISVVSGETPSGLSPATMVANALAVPGARQIEGLDGVYIEGGQAIAAVGGRGVTLTITGIVSTEDAAVALIKAAAAGLTASEGSAALGG